MLAFAIFFLILAVIFTSWYGRTKEPNPALNGFKSFLTGFGNFFSQATAVLPIPGVGKVVAGVASAAIQGTLDALGGVDESYKEPKLAVIVRLVVLFHYLKNRSFLLHEYSSNRSFKMKDSILLGCPSSNYPNQPP